ncbi:FkbM family methyltransferase [Amylibacter sp.]|nr:FkbM family methyltransferase [Amylibacter sp.]
MEIIRAGPINHILFGWKFRFFPFENTGDRKALLTPSGFDKSECNLIEKYLRPNAVFLDIGANIGTYSFAIAAKRKDVKIFAFEPTPRVFDKLSFNVNSNDLSGSINVLNVALSDRKGEMKFNTKLESLVLGEGNITVKTDTLLNVLISNNILEVGALKIDVEGAEDQILKPYFDKAPRSLWPSMIVIEHVFPDKWDWDCISFIEANGYEKIWRGKFNTVYRLI